MARGSTLVPISMPQEFEAELEAELARPGWWQEPDVAGITRGMAAHMRRHAGVAEKGCRALASLVTKPPTPVGKAANQDLIARLGGIEAVLEVRARHRDNAKVQNLAFRALIELTWNNAGNQALVVRLGGIEAALEACARHDDDPYEWAVQEQALRVLNNLAVNANNRALIARLGGIEAVLKVLASTAGVLFDVNNIVTPVTEQALAVLLSIALSDPELQRQVKAAGGEAVIKNALDHRATANAKTWPQVVSAVDPQGYQLLNKLKRVGCVVVEPLAEADPQKMVLCGCLQCFPHWVAPLWVAARGGKRTIVQLLLKAGADKEATNDGKTALWIAAEGGHGPVVEALLKAGADKEATNDGKTALWVAAERRYGPVVEALLKAGADTEARDPNGQSLLCFSAIVRRHGVMGPLLKAGANTETRWKEKGSDPGFFEGTPLFYSAYNGDMDAVKALVEAGADKEARGTVYDNPNAWIFQSLMRLPVKGGQVCLWSIHYSFFACLHSVFSCPFLSLTLCLCLVVFL